MTSVGYGDTYIESPYERISAIICMVLTSTILGYFVGGLKHAIIKSSEEIHYFRSIILDFKHFAEVNKLDKKLKIKIINYIKYLEMVTSRNILNENQILSILSVPLREQISVYVRGFILIKIEPFNKFSRPCLKTLGEKLQNQIFAPKDIIFRQGQLTTSLYFIVTGRVEIFHNNTNTTFAILTDGNQFGEIGFFLDTPRCASALSASYSEL